jgi:hypothetical protein
MLYRYFGDPNATFGEFQPGAAAPARAGRLWAANGELNEDVFGFAIGDVLAAAGQASAAGEDSGITLANLFAGLAARGDLTRLMLDDLGIDASGYAGGGRRTSTPPD